MKSICRYALAGALAVSLAGCRQADGPMPVPDEEVQNRLGDLSRDLVSVAAGQPNATDDFTHDLRVFAWSPQAADSATQFGQRLAGVLPGTRLTDQTADQLARSCWTVVAARQMSERQVEALQSDLQGLLTSIGVSEDKARMVTADVNSVQKLVTTRAKRWYEIF